MISLPWKRLLLITFLLALIGFSTVAYWRWGHLWFGKPAPPNLVTEQLQYADNKLVESKDIPFLSRVNQELSGIAERAQKAVVGIESRGTSEIKTIAQDQKTIPLNYTRTLIIGSGVIVTKQGHILTNNHVVEGCHTFLVTFYDGKRCYAEKIGVDIEKDIAVLKIMSRMNFSPLAFGDINRIKLGEMVMSFGNAYGLGVAVTEGTISAKTRYFNHFKIRRIQTDAAIHPGHSGGPLLNIYGEIIGLNTNRYTNEDFASEGGGASNLGFAIPVDQVKSSFELICKYPQWVFWNMGIVLLEDTEHAYKPYFNFLKKESDTGIIVDSIIPNSQAERLGVKQGDVIVNMNGHVVKTHEDFNELVKDLPLDQPVDIVVWRGWRGDSAGALKKFQLTISQGIITRKRLSRRVYHVADLHCKLTPIGIMEECSNQCGGFKIKSISAKSILASRLKPGDIIERVNHVPLLDEESLKKIIALKDERIDIMYYRDGRRMTTTIFGGLKL